MTEAAKTPDVPAVQAKLQWTGHDDLVPVVANQMLVRVDATNAGMPDGVSLIFGLAEPPLLLDPEAVAAMQAMQNPVIVESRAVAKVTIGTARLREFADVMARVADQVDEALGRKGKQA